MLGRAGIAVQLVLLLAAGAAAQQAAPDTVATWQLNLTDPDLEVDLWPPRLRAYGLVWLPNGTAGDATGLGVGLDTVLPYRIKNDQGSLASELSASFTGTTKNQWRVALGTDLYWNRNRHYFDARVSYDDLARQFYGIGPASEENAREFYGPRELLTVLETTWRLARRTLALGPRLEYQHHAASELADGGRLASGAVPGTAGGALWGLGLALNWDRRDDRYRPGEGWYVQAQALRFSGTNSADYRFWSVSFDWRAYRRLARTQVLAAQLYAEGVGDGTPFYRLASLGGLNHSRAYPHDRWLDDVLLAGQAEWRWQALRRWGLVGFAGAAVVGGSVGELEARYLRPSVGVGLRYLTEQGDAVVPLRLDAAVGYQSLRLSLGIGEAF